MGAGGKNQTEPDVVIARIVKARGIRGEVACQVETDFPERFEMLEAVTVILPGGRARELTVEDHWFHQERVILKFAGLDTRNDAEALVGGKLVIPEAEAMPLAEDEFYEYQLIGAAAVTVEGKGLGRVTRLIRTGGTDVLVVEGADGRELLIPFNDDICPEVDPEAKRITVNPPEGLLEL